MLEGVANSLVDFHEGLDFRVVGSPVGTHRSGRRVGRADSTKLVKIGIQHLRIFILTRRCPCGFRSHQRAEEVRARPVREHHVPMSARVLHRPLVREERYEPRGRVIQVGGLLGDPPVVFRAAVVMVAATDPVKLAGVDRVPPHVFQLAPFAAPSREISVWRWNSPRSS